MPTIVVTTTADSGAGSLRDAIANSSAGDTITFGVAPNSTITLASDLPQIAHALTIDGAGAAGLTVDGASLYRVFWAESGAITLENLTIAHGLALGGDGGHAASGGGGGGGAGMGGALFIDQTANVTLRAVTFSADQAHGGNGETTLGGAAQGAGGGGLDANGANVSVSGGGDGGGPSGGSGGTAGGTNPGGAGGDFSGGGGGGAFGLGPAGAGGAGGFGGGGGGGGLGNPGGNGGAGGFGGGGGGGGNTFSASTVGGAAGYGGGAGMVLFSGGGAGLGGAVFVRGGGTLNLADVTFSADNTVVGGTGGNGGSAEGAAVFLMGGGALAYDVGAASATIASGFEGDANLQLTKTGAGRLIVSAASDFDQLTVAGGTLQVDANLAGAVTTVQTGATLQGGGVVGALSVQSGGVLAPGDSPGVLSAGNLALAAGATLEEQLGGTSAGQFDQLHVTGTVGLGGAGLSLSLVGGFAASVGQSLTIVDNDGVDAVTGTFTSLAEGATLSAGGYAFQISYHGGTGNDVSLTVLSAPSPEPPPPPPTEGGPGNDLVFLDGNANTYAGMGGNDEVVALAGADSVHGDAGNDTLSGGEGDDQLSGDDGDDRLIGDVGADSLAGGAGSDTVEGGDGSDTLQGNADADSLTGGAGDDLMYGGRGDDALVGGHGADRLVGDLGDDQLQGAVGNDSIEGGEGADTLHGGQGNDVLVGGDGNDWLSGDRGDDLLTGGAGADTFHIGLGAGHDMVVDFSAAEGDRVQVDLGLTWSVSQAGADTVVSLSDGSTLVLANMTAAALSGAWIFSG
jgi:hypothetical protein